MKAQGEHLKLTRQIPLNWPSKAAFKKRLAAIPRYLKHAFREGLKSAEKEFRASYGGQGYFRPGQRMEVDGWVCHLHAPLGNTTFWEDLPEDVRKRLTKVRVVFIVVIAVATGSVLGIHISWSEDADSVTAALRMVLEDKSLRAQRLGCKSGWPQYGWVNWVHDKALVYSKEELVTKVLKAIRSDQHSVVGAPWLRGTIESFFKTIASDLLSYFTGQTGSNIVARTEFQTQDQASVTVDELIEKSIIWIVDKYHNANHPDLGMSPLAAWHKLSQLSPPRPGPAKLMEIFGLRFTRTVGVTGISMAGAQYQSHSLQFLRRLSPSSRMTAWFDPENLGQIMVQVPPKTQDKIGGQLDGWLLVPGHETLSGVTLRHLQLVDDDLEVRFGYDKFTSAARIRDFTVALASFARDAERLRLTENP